MRAFQQLLCFYNHNSYISHSLLQKKINWTKFFLRIRSNQILPKNLLYCITLLIFGRTSIYWSITFRLYQKLKYNSVPFSNSISPEKSVDTTQTINASYKLSVEGIKEDTQVSKGLFNSFIGFLIRWSELSKDLALRQVIILDSWNQTIVDRRT